MSVIRKMLCGFIISSRNDAIAATRTILVDIDLVAGNLIDRAVVIWVVLLVLNLLWSGSKVLETFLRGKVVLDSGSACGHSNRKRVGLVLAEIAVEWQ